METLNKLLALMRVDYRVYRYSAMEALARMSLAYIERTHQNLEPGQVAMYNSQTGKIEVGMKH